MIKIRPNLRNVRRGKALRRHSVDIWNTLVTSRKINRVSKRIYYAYARRLKKLIKVVCKNPSLTRPNMLKAFKRKSFRALRYYGKNLPRLPLKLHPRGRRRKHNTPVGMSIKQRRILSLLLTGGRIRRHQLRILSRKGRLYQRVLRLTEKSGRLQHPTRYNTFSRYYTSASIIDRRLDAVLVRSHFTKTVFQAREFIKHGKVLVNGRRITLPSHTVPHFTPVTLSLSYRIRRKKELHEIMKAKGLTFYVPSYYYVDFTLMLIWLWRNALYSTPDMRTHLPGANKTTYLHALSR